MLHQQSWHKIREATLVAAPFHLLRLMLTTVDNLRNFLLVGFESVVMRTRTNRPGFSFVVVSVCV